MSDLPQGYSHIELDKGYIELEGQTLCFNDYPSLFKIIAETVPQMIAEYTKEDKLFDLYKQDMRQNKDINP